jgi:hypothetical protein
VNSKHNGSGLSGTAWNRISMNDKPFATLLAFQLPSGNGRAVRGPVLVLEQVASGMAWGAIIEDSAVK